MKFRSTCGLGLLALVALVVCNAARVAMLTWLIVGGHELSILETFGESSFASSEIKKEDKYPGVRVTFLAYIGGARVNLQCDIGSGDSVYPSAELMEYPVLLNGKVSQVRVYPRYTVVAEKFQVMVARGLLNSRLKDYYDLWLLTERFDFDRTILRTAVERTFARRETAIPHALPDALTVTHRHSMAHS